MVTTIFPADRGDARTLARALLDAAGPDRHDEVTTVTQGALGIAYEVPEDLAAMVLGTSGKAEGSAVVPSGHDDDPAVESGGSGADADAGARRPSKAARARPGAST